MQLLLTFQSESGEDSRFEGFLSAVRDLAKQHGVSLDDAQSINLAPADFRIEACCRCEHLTLDRNDVDEEVESMLPDFWFYVRRGSVQGNRVICDLCHGRGSAV